MSWHASQFDDAGVLPEFIEAGLRSFVARVAGFVLFAAAAATWISLLTWSVDEPGLTQMTNAPAHNAMGSYGGLVSDLLLQSVGLAAVIGCLPLAFWGHELFTRFQVDNPGARLIFWPVATVALSASLAALPAAGAWPLHHGYGGLIGDFLYGFLSQLLDTVEPSISGLLAGVLYAWAALATFKVTLGLTNDDLRLIFIRSGDGGARPRGRSPRSFRAPGLLTALLGLARTVDAKGTRTRPPEKDAVFDPPFERAASRENNGVAGGEADVGGPAADQPARPADEAATDEAVGSSEHWSADGDDGSALIARRFAPDVGPRVDLGAVTAAEVVETIDESDGEDPDDEVSDHLPAYDGGSCSDIIGDGAAGAQLDRETAGYRRPSARLLSQGRESETKTQSSERVLRGSARLLEDVLEEFGVKGRIVNVRPGPVVTIYELEPERGVKKARVIGLADDIARAMSAESARVAPVSGRNVLGIELANDERSPARLRSLLESKTFRRSAGALPVALGQTMDGEPAIADLARMPHLLAAGAPGAGLSGCVHAMLVSLLYGLTPEDLRLVLIDPTMRSLTAYSGIPHLEGGVISDPGDGLAALRWTVREMEERHKRMAKLGVRSLQVYNNRVRNAERHGRALRRKVQTGYDSLTGQAMYEEEGLTLQPLPRIVVAIDEYADLMVHAPRPFHAAVQQLAQSAQAAGIHLIAATRHPTPEVLTGRLKAALNTRLAFRTASAAGSRAILGQVGAEQLLGNGDMLCSIAGGESTRLHAPVVSDADVVAVVDALRAQGVTGSGWTIADGGLREALGAPAG